MNDYTFSRARLNALAGYRILDTPSEKGFDSIVELAAHICACPVSLVSLVDRDRQWFKARVNFPPCETDLSSSVCAHALVEPDILIIPDLTADPRTSANPLVTGEPHIRFYAGAPLRNVEGHAIGSLCVIDKQTRPEGLTEAQASALKALADQVMTQIELRSAIADQQRLIGQGEALIRTQALIATAKGDLDVILAALIKGALEVIRHAEGGVIELREGDHLIYRATAGTIIAEKGFRVLVGDSLAGECLLSGKPLLVDDVVKEGRVRPYLIERLKLRSCVMVPLFLGGHPIAVIKLQSGQTQAFTRQDLQLLQVFASTATSGLAEAAYRRQAKTLKRIVELGDRLRDAATPAEAILIGGEIAGRALKGLRAGYCTVDPDTDLLTVPEHWGESSIAGRYSLRDFGSFSDELKHGKPVVIDDVMADPRTTGHVANFQALGIGSVINLPLLERGRMTSIFFVHRADPHHWTDEQVALCGNIADRLRAAVAKLQAEAQQQVLNEELSHRMKNTMAMVQAIAIQTLKDVPDKEAVASFTDRVHAMSMAHGLLMEGSWTESEIRQVVAGVLGNFRQPERFEIDGTSVRLGPRSVMALSLLLHELTTNAVKYGALSVEGGRVSLTWCVEPGPGGQELVVDWVERGGPAVREPTRKGFGSRLIRMGLVGLGGVNLNYEASGFSAEMRALLSHVQQS